METSFCDLHKLFLMVLSRNNYISRGGKYKNILVVQHTQSIQHTNGMIGAWADWDLTDYEREQAEKR